MQALKQSIYLAFFILVGMGYSDVRDFRLGTQISEIPLFSAAAKENIYQVKFLVRNDLTRGHLKQRNCQIRLDKTAPSLAFAINKSTKPPRMDYADRVGIALASPADSIEFESQESDLSYVEFCTFPLLETGDTNVESLRSPLLTAFAMSR